VETLQTSRVVTNAIAYRLSAVTALQMRIVLALLLPLFRDSGVGDAGDVNCT